ARDAIVKPIEQYNKSIGDPALQVNIEPELVDAVLDEVKAGRVSLTETGAGRIKDGTGGESQDDDTARIETPFLQLVMTRLWDEELRAGSHTLRLETLKRLGGAERIVRTHLDNTLGSLPSNERAAAAAMFYYLVTPSGTKIAHTARDLAEYTNNTEPQLTPVLEKMSASGIRILRPVAPPPDHLDAPTRYEIFHDVLAPAMLDWRRRYIQQQQNRRRNRLIAFGAVIGLLAIALIVGTLYMNLQQSQRQLEQKAQEAQSLSEAILAVPQATEDPNATVPPTLVAIRETAAAVGTSSAAVTCQSSPSIRFTTSKNTIAPGEAVTLSWSQAAHVTGVSISPDIGKVGLEGSQEVKPTEDTLYTLTATGCDRNTTQTVAITVIQPTGAPSPVPPTATPLPPTPTAAPPTPTRPRPTATQNVPPTATQINAPPGVYVTGMTVDPPNPHAGDPVHFRTSFLNTTGGPRTYKWCVYIFNPDDFPRKHTSESTCTPAEIPAGANVVEAQPWTQNRLGTCLTYLASPFFIETSGAPVMFLKPDNSNFWVDFTICP
ncbi:MAG TPA: hypothetical protein VFD70_27330, partial [Anaerolineae bacterium]|nr:hypothetical protein [Anaerolineae bacterium]